MTRNLILFVNLVLFLVLSSKSSPVYSTPFQGTPSQGQENSHMERSGNIPLDAKIRSEIVKAVTKCLHEYYVYPEMAAKAAMRIESNLSKGNYDRYSKRDPFISRLTDDLRLITNDLHLGVWPIETSITLQETSQEEKKKYEDFLSYTNFGIPVAKRLHGNIGYLEILDFEGTLKAVQAADGAMRFLSHCDALIIDLRRCGGGEGDVGRTILSYLFAEPMHLTTFHIRHSKKTLQSWAIPNINGSTMTDIPVYILLSRRSASAAEGMSYNLKALKRATIVGERSRGAANTVDELNFPELSICVAVSSGEVINPITGTSWEGVGVEPDIEVPAEHALSTACKQAIKNNLKNESDEALKKLRQWALDFYEAATDPVELDAGFVNKLCGKYSKSVSVYQEKGQIYWKSYGGETRFTLIPVGQDAFAVREVEVRVQALRDSKGNVSSICLTNARGYELQFTRISSN